jgi:predicted GNAT family acetyltransferase
MPDLEITREDSETKARYVGRIDGLAEEAELTLSKASPTLVIADHTSVPEAMRGQGVGHQLLARLIDDARAAGQTILPLCPFVKAQARKHRDEWADVFQL